MDTEALLNRPYFSFKHGIYNVKRPAEVSNGRYVRNQYIWWAKSLELSERNDKLMDLASVLNEVSVIVYMP